jgi:DMSO reductase anchor subunit
MYYLITSITFLILFFNSACCHAQVIIAEWIRWVQTYTTHQNIRIIGTVMTWLQELTLSRYKIFALMI